MTCVDEQIPTTTICFLLKRALLAGCTDLLVKCLAFTCIGINDW